MKVGIITFHRADNYGAMLQALALMNAIKKMGHEVDIIDYRCSAIENFYKYKLLPHSNYNTFHYNPFNYKPFNYVRGVIHNIKWNPILKRKSRKCEVFRNNYYQMSRAVVSVDNRKEIEDEYDVILTGSDQIWRSTLTHGKDDWYAFSRFSNSTIIASYAASVGNLNVFRKYYKLYKNDLEKYNFISVREHNLQLFLSQRTNKDIQVVADPTLLLENEFWYDITKEEKRRLKPYILYYDVNYNDDACMIVRNIAENKGLNVVYFEKMLRGKYHSINMADADPIEFLGLIRNAEYIVTSSFHATVFSIVFKKEFITVLHPRTGDRVKSLLLSLGLSSHLVSNKEQFDMQIINSKTDWITVNNKISNMRKSSMEFLSQCLGIRKQKE